MKCESGKVVPKSSAEKAHGPDNRCAFDCPRTMEGGRCACQSCRHLYRSPRPCASNLTHSQVGRDNLSVYFAKMADDLVLENDVEAGKVTTRPVTENSYTDVRHGSVLE
jgi:hypothetical protein